MNKESSIVVTGAAGFIGSCLVRHLNDNGFRNLVLVDKFDEPDKLPNLSSKSFTQKVDRKEFFNWVNNAQPSIDFIFHLGARTDTIEFDYSVHEELNVSYSKKVWNYCCEKNIPLVYASSAATYGKGELGYDDDHRIIPDLKPLNSYGISKNEFDKWVIQQQKQPPFWAGLKFFNVYGPNEYHKGRMASVIFHSFNQIQAIEKVKLFKSYKPEYKDGQQLRDFVYVKDIIDVCCWLMHHQPKSAIYNVGTGKARTFEDLVKATFSALTLDPVIEYIDMPEDIKNRYQYFTEAKMEKLRTAGYDKPMYSLEEGVRDYVANYLVSRAYF